MLAGRSPSQARTPTALREQILFKPPTPFRGVAANIPVDLESICLRCLAKHPADRYATANELAQALRAALANKPRRGRLLPILIMGTISVFLVLLLCWWFVLQGRAPTKSQKDGLLVFDGRSRIITPVEQFAPVTLEAWVRPEKYEDFAPQEVFRKEGGNTTSHTVLIYDGANVEGEGVIDVSGNG